MATRRLSADEYQGYTWYTSSRISLLCILDSGLCDVTSDLVYISHPGLYTFFCCAATFRPSLPLHREQAAAHCQCGLSIYSYAPSSTLCWSALF
jgi:hypothetical protein